MWVFDLDPATGAYRFSQVAQNLLHGDSPIITPVDGEEQAQ